ncbi:unnamed protein product [Prunus brigantina]
MKVLKGYVQSRTHPECCITERYIAEEVVEFCTEHLSNVSTVGVPSSQKIGVSKPLSGDVRIECEPFTRGMPNVDNELVGFGHKTISTKNTGSRLQT